MRSLIACTYIAAILSASVSADSNSFDFARLKGRPNLNQTSVGTSGDWTLEKLLALSQKDGLELWKTLPPVPVKEMNGHYMGLVPAADDPKKQREWREGIWNHNSEKGYWLGKAFRPIADNIGEGYNRTRLADGTIRHFGRMGTRIAQSLIDGKPSYVIDYSVFSNQNMYLDELRKLDDFVYLGILVDPRKVNRTDPQFWILIGPTDRWVGPTTK